ncbi:MAG: Gfo/Idh/MocA family oxidoreductase [bacterium]
MAKTAKTRIGVIGCGNISGIYFQNCHKFFHNTEVVACADLVREKAEAAAKEYGVPSVRTVEDLLSSPDVDIVLNLTVPKVHATIALAALQAGKHVHGEKPLATCLEDGRKIVDLAKRKKLRVGSAPDTFLGAGIQTCRKLIDDGWIGKPVAATAFMMCRGHESWHPSPEFYYEVGGGPMLDMGPYYLTALVNLLGPIRRVTGSTRVTFPTRTITSQPKSGKLVKVETPTHLAGVLDFDSGAVGTIITSFDIVNHHLPCIEIHGSEGSLQVPDPNSFGGEVLLYRAGAPEWQRIPYSHGYAENSRGIGVADMASAIATKRPHRASSDLAYHVLDVMLAFQDASDTDRHVKIESTCSRPAALPMGLRPGELD